MPRRTFITRLKTGKVYFMFRLITLMVLGWLFLSSILKSKCLTKPFMIAFFNHLPKLSISFGCTKISLPLCIPHVFKSALSGFTKTDPFPFEKWSQSSTWDTCYESHVNKDLKFQSRQSRCNIRRHFSESIRSKFSPAVWQASLGIDSWHGLRDLNCL